MILQILRNLVLQRQKLLCSCFFWQVYLLVECWRWIENSKLSVGVWLIMVIVSPPEKHPEEVKLSSWSPTRAIWPLYKTCLLYLLSLYQKIDPLRINTMKMLVRTAGFFINLFLLLTKFSEMVVVTGMCHERLCKQIRVVSILIRTLESSSVEFF